MNLVLIPEWLKSVLTKNSRPLTDALEPEKLLGILSKEDVAFYIFLNNNLSRWINEPAVYKDFSRPFNSTGEALQLSTQLEYSNKKPNSYELFGPLSEEVQIPSIQFKVIMVDQETVGLVPFVESSQVLFTSGYKNLIDDLLAQMNDRLTFSELAKTSLFKRFLSYPML